MRVCLAWEGDRLRAAFPLVERHRRSLAAMANVHTPVFRPVGSSPEAVRAVVEAALAEGSGNLELPAVPVGDPSLTFAARGHRGRRAAPRDRLPARVADRRTWGPRGVAAAVEAALGRADRALPPQDGARPRGRALDRRDPADLESELARGFAVEASGWKGESGTAILSDPRTLTFYREIAHGFAERGELRLSRIVLDGHWAAFDLCLLYRDRLYLLKTGYDERFRKLAPGLVMRLSIIERCFELGLDAHELLGDDTEWKRKFVDRRARATWASTPTSAGLRGSVSYRTGRRARPLLKRAYEARSRGFGPVSRIQPEAGVAGQLGHVHLRLLELARVVPVHRLPARELIEHPDPRLAAAVARLAVPAEGKVRLGARGRVVHRHHSRAHPLAEAEGPLGVVRVDGRRQPVAVAVGQVHRLVEVAELGHADRSVRRSRCA